jgi:hypothetical protein
MIRVRFLPDPNSIQHHRPSPVVSTPVDITWNEIVLKAIIAQPPNWFGRILSLMLCATTLLVSVPDPNKFWNFRACGTCRQSIWVSHPQRMSTVYSRHMLFNSFIFSFPDKTHKLLKFSIAMRIEWEGFNRGMCPYLFSFCIEALVAITWRRAVLSSLARWYELS